MRDLLCGPIWFEQALITVNPLDQYFPDIIFALPYCLNVVSQVARVCKLYLHLFRLQFVLRSLYELDIAVFLNYDLPT